MIIHPHIKSNIILLGFRPFTSSTKVDRSEHNIVAGKNLNEKEEMKRMENTIQNLRNENTYLRAQIKESDINLVEYSNTSDNNNQSTMNDLKNKLLVVEEKSHQLEEENTKLTSNVQSLQQEVEEVKDNFREDRITNEYKQLKKELMIEAKNCRALQFKLKKAERSIKALAKGEDEESEAGVASAMDIMSQIKELNTDNILIINSILNNKKIR